MEAPSLDGRPNPWRTYRACIDSTPGDASHVLIVQDDAQPADGFREAAVEAIRERPDRIIVFFVPGIASGGARQILDGRKRGSRWVELPTTCFLPLVATAWPVGLAREFMQWADENLPANTRGDDGAAHKWIRATKTRAVATAPSLVQHPDVEPSLVGHRNMAGRNPTRVAAWFEPEATGWVASRPT